MFSSSDHGLNLPSVSSNPQYGSISPYLNFDPSYITQSGPEFIMPEGASAQRGRFEQAFTMIGSAVMGGGCVGGLHGGVTGWKKTLSLQQSPSLRLTQALNHATKAGAGAANTCGVLVVMYSGLGVLASLTRGTDDELNTLAAATLTGLIYKAPAGLRKSALGAGVGLAAACGYLLLTSRDKIKSMLQSN